jgi:hypothetical protein
MPRRFIVMRECRVMVEPASECDVESACYPAVVVDCRIACIGHGRRASACVDPVYGTRANARHSRDFNYEPDGANAVTIEGHGASTCTAKPFTDHDHPIFNGIVVPQAMAISC